VPRALGRTLVALLAIAFNGASFAGDWTRLTGVGGFGEVSGVDVDAADAVYVFHRANRRWRQPFACSTIGAATVLKFEGGRFGRVVRRACHRAG
jgi:hypothetical protein